MSNDKYYTPDISEIYVGFQFEAKQLINVYDEVTYEVDWYETELYSLDSTYYDPITHGEEVTIDKCLDKEYPSIRVKYLDKSDIESLGFKQIESSFSHDIYEIPFSYKIIKDKMSNLENHYFIHFINGYGGKETQIFSGFIKNKSELKVLLKQLGIDE